MNTPKGWGLAAGERPAIPAGTAGAGEVSSSRGGGGGGGGGEEVQAVSARRSGPEEPQRRARRAPATWAPATEEARRPTAASAPAEEVGGLGDAAHVDISGIVESTLSRRLSKHELALKELLQDLLDAQQTKFVKSLEKVLKKLEEHAHQAEKVHKEVMSSKVALSNEVGESKDALRKELAAAQQAIDSITAGQATIIEQLAQPSVDTQETRTTRRGGTTELRPSAGSGTSSNMSSIDEVAPAGTVRIADDLETPPSAFGLGMERQETLQNSPPPRSRQGNHSIRSEVRRDSARTGKDHVRNTARTKCPSCWEAWDWVTRTRKSLRRSYKDSLAEYRRREDRSSILDCIADSRAFEYMMVFIICMHVVYLIYQTDLAARTLTPATGSSHVGVEVAFQLMYILELGLKIKTQRMYFVFGADRYANAFDTFLVMAGCADIVALQIQSDVLMGAGSSSLRVLRICRLQRVVRMHRIFTTTRAMQVILRCLYSAASGLFGSSCIILLYFLIFSLFLVSAVTDHLMDGNGGENQEFFERNFSSVSRCMFTLYVSVSSGTDWLYYYEPLKDITTMPAATTFVIFSFIYTVMMVNVASSIFIQKVLMYSIDESHNAKHKMTLSDLDDADHLNEFCKRKQGLGETITFREFLFLMERPEFKEHFDSRLITARDASEVFKTFSWKPSPDADEVIWELHNVNRKLFFETCMRLKRGVTTVDMATSKVALEDTKAALEDNKKTQEAHGERLEKIEQQLEKLSKDKERTKSQSGNHHPRNE